MKRSLLLLSKGLGSFFTGLSGTQFAFRVPASRTLFVEHATWEQAAVHSEHAFRLVNGTHLHSFADIAQHSPFFTALTDLLT